MIVVPAGSYMMGSPAEEVERDADEGPVHMVTIGAPLAVGRYEITFSQWDACHEAGGCSHNPDDQGWGRGNRPVVDVNWHDAQEYMSWLSEKTGRQYRLLSESEWEYVARAGADTRYWWGDEIGSNRANCSGCGSLWDGQHTAPVGSFSPNGFGLYDVYGNVWEWVEDCQATSYEGAPDDGTAWLAGNCDRHYVRGGSWENLPRYVRSANRGWNTADLRGLLGSANTGFRVARVLDVATRHTLPWFRAAGRAQSGFARITNHSDRAGTVSIVGFDDTGQEYGPVTLSLNARESRHFNSEDLETGNSSVGLTGSLGDGAGDWRLELTSDLDIEPSVYIVTTAGFVAPMHGIVRTIEVEGDTVHQVPILGPGDAERQMNWLRLVNVGSSSANVTIQGRDDAGEPAPEGEVMLSLPAGGARTLSAQQLEDGDVDITGRLGDGTGNWRLSVSADGAIEAMSLHQGSSSQLSDLSTALGATSADFVISTDAPATIRPLQTLSLAVSGGLTERDYLVLMDLSGTGSFPEDDTIEVPALTTDRNQLLLAAPMTQALSEQNLTHEFAVRVKRGSDQRLSNTLHFSIEDFTIPAALAGYPSTVLEVVS